MKILIIEDNVDLGETIARRLKKTGQTVQLITEIENVDTVIGQVDQFDLVILDLRINGKNTGEKILTKLSHKKNETPIIILSANHCVDKRIELINKGADDYIKKPFHFAELQARIEAVARRSVGRQRKVEKKYGLTFYWGENRVVNEEKEEVFLTQQEKLLLRCLVANANKIVASEEIIRKVWGHKSPHHSNILQSAIRRLRQKFNNKDYKQLIHTIHGLGYKLQEQQQPISHTKNNALL